MGFENTPDFVLDSMGHCFFCLSHILTTELELSPVPPNFSKHPLQHLSRYLKMNLRKVFKNEKNIPLPLLKKVERARLKVELCEACTALNEHFIQLYRNWEKLEMEMGSCLSLIGEKMSEANKMSSRTEELKTLVTSLNSDKKSSGVLEIFEVLRLEASQKCSRKLYTATPLVKCENLTKKKVRKELSQFKTNCVVSKIDQEILAWNPNLDEIIDIKMELDNPTSGFLSDNDNNSSHFSDDSKSYDVRIKEKTLTKKLKDNVPPSTFIHSNLRRKFNLGRAQGAPGNYKCGICSKNCVSRKALRNHHESVHLNKRFQCESCNALFTLKGNLKKHQSTTNCAAMSYSVTKLKCQFCQKIFLRNGNLQVHLRAVHFNLRNYECKFCSKKFTMKHHVNNHQNLHCKLRK